MCKCHYKTVIFIYIFIKKNTWTQAVKYINYVTVSWGKGCMELYLDFL